MGLRLLMVAALLIALGDPAQAQGALDTAVDAERLRGAVRDYLDRLAAGDARRGRPPVGVGEITAVQQGETARLAIAGLTISGPGSGPAGARLEIGSIEVEVAPDDIGRYRVAVEPPNRFDVIDDAGRPLCRIAVGDQNWTGLWSTDIAGFVEINGNLADVGWRCAGSRHVFARAIAVAAVMTETQAGRWRGYVNLGLEETSLRDLAEPDFRLDFDHLRLTIAYENMDIGRRRDAIAANGAPSWAAALPALAIPLDAFGPDGNAELWRYASPATARLEAAGLKLASDSLTARGGFELSLTGYQDRGNTLTFEIVYAQDAELAVAGSPIGPGEVWLDLVFAGLALDSLSPSELSRMLVDPARLLAAAREITIRSVAVSTPQGEIRGTGVLYPARGNFPPVHGELNLETEDLAGLILDFLTRFGGSTNQAYDAALRATVTELGGGDPNIERFEVRIDRDGGISVNRRSFAAILALFHAQLAKR